MKMNRALLVKSQDLAKRAMKNIEEEVISEKLGMVKDYIKGVYWYREDLENQVSELNQKIADIDDALESARKGDLGKVKKVPVPAKFLDEKTVRVNDIDWEEEK